MQQNTWNNIIILVILLTGFKLLRKEMGSFVNIGAGRQQLSVPQAGI